MTRSCGTRSFDGASRHAPYGLATHKSAHSGLQTRRSHALTRHSNWSLHGCARSFHQCSAAAFDYFQIELALTTDFPLAPDLLLGASSLFT